MDSLRWSGATLASITTWAWKYVSDGFPGNRLSVSVGCTRRQRRQRRQLQDARRQYFLSFWLDRTG